MMIRLLLATALLGYAVSWLIHLRGFRGHAPGARPRSTWLFGASTLFHAAGLLAFWLTFRTPPLVGFGPASATLAFATAVTYLAAARNVEAWPAGLFLLPPVILLLGASILTGMTPTPPATAFRGLWFVVHVVSVLLGYAGLLFGSVAAAMYVLQFRALKRKHFGNVFRSFPSLESLDRMNAIALISGLGALTIGLIAGWSFTLTFGRGFALGRPEVAFGLLTWVAYGIALMLRWTGVSKSPRAAEMTLVAFAACALAFLLIRTFSPAREFFL